MHCCWFELLDKETYSKFTMYINVCVVEWHQFELAIYVNRITPRDRLVFSMPNLNPFLYNKECDDHTMSICLPCVSIYQYVRFLPWRFLISEISLLRKVDLLARLLFVVEEIIALLFYNCLVSFVFNGKFGASIQLLPLS